MKVGLNCRSALLEASLKKFLKRMVVPLSEAQIVICDYACESDRPVLRIGTDEGADLRKPFNRSQLLIRLEDVYKRHQNRAALAMLNEEEGLEERLQKLTKEFVAKVVATVKEYYEKS